MPVIRVDVHERASTFPQLLADLGASVNVEPLRFADYDVGGGALVERKSVADLHLSIIRGRFWSQLGALRGATRYAYLLVEGIDLEAGPLTGSSVRGACLAALEQRIRVLRAFDVDESALWLYRLAVRCQRRRRRIDRPAYAQRPKPRSSNAVAEAALAAVPGISTTTARKLLSHFGSLHAVLDAKPEEWVLVPGVGPHRAASLHAAVSARWRSQRAQGPST